MTRMAAVKDWRALTSIPGTANVSLRKIPPLCRRLFLPPLLNPPRSLQKILPPRPLMHLRRSPHLSLFLLLHHLSLPTTKGASRTTSRIACQRNTPMITNATRCGCPMAHSRGASHCGATAPASTAAAAAGMPHASAIQATPHAYPRQITPRRPRKSPHLSTASCAMTERLHGRRIKVWTAPLIWSV